MPGRNKQRDAQNQPQPTERRRTSITDENIERAYEQAEKDIENDPDFLHNENEDLDEGELGRLGGDRNSLA